MPSKPTILLVGCSIKSRDNGKYIIDRVKKIKDDSSLREYIERILREKRVCNSERGLVCSTFGAKDYPVDLKYIRLNKWFRPDGSVVKINEPIKEIEEADGIIFATPVYFGAPTSLLWELLEEIKRRGIDLFPKVVGFVVSGAKRNGGHEATIIFTGMDVMALGACIVNDGYPISQFGGTVWAGLVGHSAENDDFGIRTSIGVGKRVAETALILKNGKREGQVKMFYWAPKGNFHRCHACDVCPSPELAKLGRDFKCRNDKDDMVRFHDEIIASNLIIPIRYNLKFEERTRYLRRDNYRLTYHVVQIPEPKWFSLFIKLNCILVRNHLEDYAQLVTTGRQNIKTTVPIYEPVGHENPYLK